MIVKIKQFDKSLPLPEYKSEGAACVDLYSRVDIDIAPGEVASIPLNIALEIPKGYFVFIAARTSTHKLGIMPVNGIGIGDWDFRGDNDEYQMAALNFTKNAVHIERGTRVAQMMVIKYEKIEFETVEKMPYKDRGMYGSTGTK